MLGGLSLARQFLCASCFPPTHSPATLTLYQNPSPPSHPTSRIGSRCSGCQQRSQRRPGLFYAERGPPLLRANSAMCLCENTFSGVFRIHFCLASIVLRFAAFWSFQKSLLSRFDCSEIRLQTFRRLVLSEYSWGRSLVIHVRCLRSVVFCSLLSFLLVLRGVVFRGGARHAVQRRLHRSACRFERGPCPDGAGALGLGCHRFGRSLGGGTVVDRPAGSFLLVSVGSKLYCLSFGRSSEN